MYIVTDKPLAGTSGGLLQQGQCCMPWQVAVLPIQRGECIASVPSVHYNSHVCNNFPLYLYLRQPLVGAGFAQTMQEPVVRSFLFGTSMHQASANGIYEHGALRKVGMSFSPLLCMHYCDFHLLVV